MEKAYQKTSDELYKELSTSEQGLSNEEAKRRIKTEGLNILIDKMGLIIEDSKTEKTFMFDTKDIEVFITNTVKYIIKDIEMLGISPQK